MDKITLDSFPKLKDIKEKQKKTFMLSAEVCEIYVKAKYKLGIDTTQVCTEAIERALLKIKPFLENKKD